MRNLILSMGLFSSSFAVAGPQAFYKAADVKEAIKISIQKNESAANHIEWHSSGVTSEDLFRFIRAGKRSAFQADLCNELEALPVEDLTLFENEIKEIEFVDLVSSCKKTLIKKLDLYWFKYRLKKRGLSQPPSRFNSLGNTSAPDLNFKFQTQVQTRDLSRGYYVVKGDLQPKQVVLTFDDGPNTELTPIILNTLAAVDAKVIFFHLGKNVVKNPDIVRREADEGHMIGSHSWDHPCLPNTRLCKKSNGFRLSTQEAIDQIKRGHKAIYDVLGWVAPFFRFPYGASEAPLKEFLKDHQTAEFFWNIDSNDWRKQSPEDVLRKTIAEVESQNGGVVLFHDIQRRTAEMLPEFLKELYYRNYQLVLLKPLDESQYTNPAMFR